MIPQPDFQPTKRDAKRLARSVKIGTRLYTISRTCERVHGYEDKLLFNEHTVTRFSGITGSPMIGATSVQGLLLQSSGVYLRKPAGIRGTHEAPRQVAGPLQGGAFNRPMSRSEIAQLESYVADLDEAEKAAKENKKPVKAGRWF